MKLSFGWRQLAAAKFQFGLPARKAGGHVVSGMQWTAMNSDRIVRAFLLAPLAGPALVWLAGALLPHSGSVESAPAALRALGVMVLFGAPLAYGAALVVGLPTLWWIKASRRVSAWPCLAAGAAGGILVVAVAGPSTVFFAGQGPGDYLAAALIGGAAGAVFWWIGLKPKPTRVS